MTRRRRPHQPDRADRRLSAALEAVDLESMVGPLVSLKRRLLEYPEHLAAISCQQCGAQLGIDDGAEDLHTARTSHYSFRYTYRTGPGSPVQPDLFPDQLPSE